MQKHYLKHFLSFCASGGVGLTLLGVLIYSRVSHRKNLQESKIQLDEEDRSTTVINNCVSQQGDSEKKMDVFMQTGSCQPLDKKAMMLDTRSENQDGWFWSRAEENGAYFRCLDCSTKGERGNNRINREMDLDRKTHRQPEQTKRDPALFDSFPPQHRLTDSGGYLNQFELMEKSGFRKESRNVKFDWENFRTLQQGNIHGEEKGKKKRHKVKIQSSRLLRVKLNLSPIQKNKVHPNKKNEQSHVDKSSSKKSKVKKEDGKNKGRKTGKKTILSGGIKKESTKSRGLGQEDKQEEDSEDRNSKTTLKEKKTTSKSDQGSQENMASNQDETGHPSNDQPCNTSSTADHLAAFAQGENVQREKIWHQDAGLAPGNGHFISQQPMSVFAVEKNSNLSVLGSSGLLTGSSLSLQGGGILQSIKAPVSNALFPNGTVHSIASNTVSINPNLGFMSPANSQHAFPLQVNIRHSEPLNHPPPDSSALVCKVKHDPAQGPGLQTEKRQHLLPEESQLLQMKESVPHRAQGSNPEGLCGVTSQAAGSLTTAENLSNNNSQTGTGYIPGVSKINILTERAVVPDRPVVDVSEDSMQAANLSAVPNVSVPSVFIHNGSSRVSVSGAAGATALLQQDHTSEEGGSSQKRKLRLVLPAKTSCQLPTALERKIR